MALEQETPRQISPEAQKVHKIVQILSEAGYTYEQLAAHIDPNQEIHFFKPLGENYFPHYHLIMNQTNGSIHIHMDTRQHKSTYIKSDIKVELERIYDYLNNRPKSIDGEINNLTAVLAKQAMTTALFGTSPETHKTSRKQSLFKSHDIRNQKLRKQSRKKHIERKHNPETEETWTIHDWIPIDEELNKLVDKKRDTKLE